MQPLQQDKRRKEHLSNKKQYTVAKAQKGTNKSLKQHSDDKTRHNCRFPRRSALFFMDRSNCIGESQPPKTLHTVFSEFRTLSGGKGNNNILYLRLETT